MLTFFTIGDRLLTFLRAARVLLDTSARRVMFGRLAKIRNEKKMISVCREEVGRLDVETGIRGQKIRMIYTLCHNDVTLFLNRSYINK